MKQNNPFNEYTAHVRFGMLAGITKTKALFQRRLRFLALGVTNHMRNVFIFHLLRYFINHKT